MRRGPGIEPLPRTTSCGSCLYKMTLFRKICPILRAPNTDRCSRSFLVTVHPPTGEENPENAGWSTTPWPLSQPSAASQKPNRSPDRFHDAMVTSSPLDANGLSGWIFRPSIFWKDSFLWQFIFFLSACHSRSRFQLEIPIQFSSLHCRFRLFIEV